MTIEIANGINELVNESKPSILKTLPLDFDPEFYRYVCSECGDMSDEQLRQHYAETGAKKGLAGSRISTRKSFLDIFPQELSVLEIGPFNSPALRGKNIKYFDVVPTEQLREKALGHGLDPSLCPEIDFVSPNGDLSVVDEFFSAVFSSHTIEHQPDLIRHLLGVSALLTPGGRYYLIVPDKRFCFDHFKPESSIAKVLAAHLAAATNNTQEAMIDYYVTMTHNDARRHWSGDHGDPAYESNLDVVRHALAYCTMIGDAYRDTHAWQFTPPSFRKIMEILFALDLIDLELERVYPTVRNDIEFFAVLKKTTKTLAPIKKSLPPDFDSALYLEANPDVAAAGADPEMHYMVFGALEGRALRPSSDTSVGTAP